MLSPQKPWLFTGDLTKVTWARAQNTKAALTKSIYDAKIVMVEVDISMGHPVGELNAPLKPMILHAPEVDSELDVQEFFAMIAPLVEGIDAPKGFKLDFKCKDSFAGTLPALRQFFHTRKKQFPIWLNGDILTGPGARSLPPIDPNYFLVECSKFAQVVISLGWLTLPSTEENGYNETDIDQMLEILKKYKLSQPITICVKATMLTASYNAVSRLVKGLIKEDTTLTVWSYQTDRPDPAYLKKLVKEIGRNRIYLDVPTLILDEMGSPTSKDSKSSR